MSVAATSNSQGSLRPSAISRLPDGRNTAGKSGLSRGTDSRRRTGCRLGGPGAEQAGRLPAPAWLGELISRRIFPRGARGRAAAADRWRDQRRCRAPGAAGRLPRPLSLRRRGCQRLPRPARPGADRASMTSWPTRGGSRAPSRCPSLSTSTPVGVTPSTLPARCANSPGPVWPPCTSRTRLRPSALRPPSWARNWWPSMKCATA